MPDQFNEQECRCRFIAGGLSETDAAAIVAKMAAARRESDQIAAPATNAIAEPTRQSAQKRNAPARPTMISESRTVPDGVPDGADAPGNVQRGAGVTTRKPRVGTGDDVSNGKVGETRRNPLRKLTGEQIVGRQLSLCEVAPWPDSMRAMPNDWLRSALFTVRNKRTPRAMMEKAPIYHVHRDVVITYTGWELRAEDDELVMQQVLEYAKRLPPGEPVTFTFCQICQALGWPVNGQYYQKVENSLTRLQACAMQFSSSRIGHLESLSLIRRFRILHKGGKRKSRCQIEIDHEIVTLFAGDHYSKFVWEKYRRLSPTARRMFDYFATHKEPFPLPLEQFRLMCGSDSSRTKKWREQVNAACNELRESGLVEGAWMREDQVHCRR